MASAYGVFANGGWLRPPVFIKRVEDADGQVLFRDASKPQHALSEETSYLMAQMLADVINAGTGSRARQAGFKFAAAGKTGTTNDFRDAWFIGFTPALVTSVWVGFDQPKTIMSGGYASELAVPIWGRFMQQAAGTTDAGWIAAPAGIVAVEICRLSGELPTDGCRHAPSDVEGDVTEKSYVGMEYFRRGTEPTEYCPLHIETGSLVDRMRSFIGISHAMPATRPALDAATPPATSAAPRPLAPPVAKPELAASPSRPAAVTPTPATTESPSTLASKLKGLFGRRPPAPPPAPPKTTGRGGG
jgi:penicillin-binding protein 1A